MRAMLFESPRQSLSEVELSVPEPGYNQVLLEVKACAVCRTDLHITDGELPNPRLPLILGHEVVGIVRKLGPNVSGFEIGDRVGVPWLGSSCDSCRQCMSGHENLCDQAGFTGYTIDGGFAEYTVANARFCFALPEDYENAHAAPLLCAGLIGYRSLLKAGETERLGIYGFGAAAHIIAQVARHRGVKIYVFTRPGDIEGQKFATKLGASWTGDSTEHPPVELDAAIIFAPVGELVPQALGVVRRGGTVVCAGIHMSAIPSFPYDLLWGERTICSVANLTRKDGEEFLAIAPRVPVTTAVETFPLEHANQALDALRAGKVQGAAVLVME